ncbi:MAG: C39 family peptidase [Bifidobacteriaceae bacterium]|jgi:uncharacterized protein YvpB|nr:C39 family peptidase [Bifidobacteriaceae bacterium]
MIIDAPYISQRGAYPTGCEAVSTVMALRHAGVGISVDQFIDGCLPLGPAPAVGVGEGSGSGLPVGADPHEAFPGNPRQTNGWGCYATAIEIALSAVATAYDSSLAWRNVTGWELGSLCRRYVAAGIPVLVWATIDMAQPPLSVEATWVTPAGRRIEWLSPEHCLLLVGYDKDGYYFHDPLAGPAVPYAKPAVRAAYDALGRQALAIHPS